MKETSKHKHGGSRPGAGRPRIPNGKRKQLSTRVDEITLKKLRAEAKRRKSGIGDVIDDLAKKLPEA